MDSLRYESALMYFTWFNIRYKIVQTYYTWFNVRHDSVQNSNCNSAFIALNLHLLTDLSHSKPKSRDPKPLNQNIAGGQQLGEKLRQHQKTRVVWFCREKGFSIFLDGERGVAECTSSGRSFQNSGHHMQSWGQNAF